MSPVCRSTLAYRKSNGFAILQDQTRSDRLHLTFGCRGEAATTHSHRREQVQLHTKKPITIVNIWMGPLYGQRLKERDTTNSVI